MGEPAGERINSWENIEEYYRNDRLRLQRHICKNKAATVADAEDIVHETVIKAFEGRTRIENLPAWCHKAAERKWRDVTRLRRFRDIGLEHAGNTPATQSPSQEVEAWDQFMALLRELTPTQQVVVLHRYCGLRNGEIAKLLDIMPSTVSSHVRHAKSRIRSYGNR